MLRSPHDPSYVALSLFRQCAEVDPKHDLLYSKSDLKNILGDQWDPETKFRVHCILKKLTNTAVDIRRTTRLNNGKASGSVHS